MPSQRQRITAEVAQARAEAFLEAAAHLELEWTEEAAERAAVPFVQAHLIREGKRWLARADDLKRRR